jgi:hypothetical protein
MLLNGLSASMCVVVVERDILLCEYRRLHYPDSEILNLPTFQECLKIYQVRWNQRILYEIKTCLPQYK